MAGAPGVDWKKKLQEQKAAPKDVMVNKVERMKNMFNAKEDTLPMAPATKKWGAVKNVVGTTQAANLVSKIRAAQAPDLAKGAKAKPKLGGPVAADKTPPPPGKKLVHDLGWLKRGGLDEEEEMPPGSANPTAVVAAAGGEEDVQYEQKSFRRTPSIAKTIEKLKTQLPDAAPIERLKSADDAVPAAADVAFPEDAAGLASTLPRQCAGGEGSRQSMDSPGGRGEAWMGGVDPPMSPLPIGEEGCKAEPAPGGATPEVHEAAVGDAVGSPVGIALARTGTADPPPAGTKAPAGDEGCSEIKAVPVDTKEGSELPAEGAAGEKAEGFTLLGGDQFQMRVNPEEGKEWQVTSEIGTSPLPSSDSKVAEGGGAPNRTSFERRVNRMTFRQPGGHVKDLSATSGEESPVPAVEVAGSPSISTAATTTRAPRQPSAAPPPPPNEKGGCWSMFGKKQTPPAASPEQIVEAKTLRSSASQTDPPERERTRSTGAVMERISSTESMDSSKDTNMLMWQRPSYGQRPTYEHGQSSPDTGIPSQLHWDPYSSRDHSFRSTQWDNSESPDKPSSGLSPTVLRENNSPPLGWHGGLASLSPTNGPSDPAAGLGSPTPPPPTSLVVISDEDLVIDNIRNASLAAPGHAGFYPHAASPYGSPPHIHGGFHGNGNGHSNPGFASAAVPQPHFVGTGGSYGPYVSGPVYAWNVPPPVQHDPLLAHAKTSPVHGQPPLLASFGEQHFAEQQMGYSHAAQHLAHTQEQQFAYPQEQQMGYSHGAPHGAPHGSYSHEQQFAFPPDQQMPYAHGAPHAAQGGGHGGYSQEQHQLGYAEQQLGYSHGGQPGAYSQDQQQLAYTNGGGQLAYTHGQHGLYTPNVAAPSENRVFWNC